VSQTVYGPAYKAYIHTLFETYSNQPLWELHENVKKRKRNMNAWRKSVIFKNLFENPVPLNICLRKQPRSVTVDKMAAIFAKRI